MGFVGILEDREEEDDLEREVDFADEVMAVFFVVMLVLALGMEEEEEEEEDLLVTLGGAAGILK